MVNHDQPDERAVAPSAPAPIPALTPKGLSRRRMAGLGMSGVVMTVASTNAMAEMLCQSPSGSLSDTHASSAPGIACSGRSPEWWATADESEFPKGVSLKHDFGRYFPTGRKLSGRSVKQVLKQAGTEKDEVAALLMATYLNVNCTPPRITFLTSQAVLDMWRKWDDDHQYQATAGAEPWDRTEFARYLRSTQAI